MSSVMSNLLEGLRRAVLMGAAPCLLTCLVNAADQERVAVLYPDLGSNFNAVFESIAAGVDQVMPGNVTRIELSPESSGADLDKRLESEKIRGVIALGRRGVQVARSLGWRGTLVVGAVVHDASSPSLSAWGIALDPDSRTVFSHLRALAPNVRRVYTVTNPALSGWSMDSAKSIAVTIGVQLEVRDAVTLRDSAIAFKEILDRIDPATEAIWLQLDPIDDEILRTILSTAWNRRFVVFSNNADHASRGALYSVIPDYNAIGKELGSLLKTGSHNNVPLGLRPNSNLRLAANLRTARHLGIQYSPATIERMDVTYK
jgi:putative ABC transport system substrate-binding protein